ncbi:hypothetical protein RI129_003286 [Pyrocoelia pectoralis]|uniref:Uncharacterized protein n=1 Tax=Pyrocoelia pectoralis TaxID=417401 RepID=A0AAN7VRG3_9COLE
MSQKKPSGFQNRKRKTLRAQEREKQSGRLLKFFKSNHDVSATSDLDRCVGQSHVQQNMSDRADENISKKDQNERDEGVSESESDMIQSECSHEIESSTSTTINSVDYNDPGNWPDYCNDNFCQILLQNPPHQIITYNFPKDSKNRRFSSIHYKRKLANGEEVYRPWLIYSTTCGFLFLLQVI